MKLYMPNRPCEGFLNCENPKHEKLVQTIFKLLTSDIDPAFVARIIVDKDLPYRVANCSYEPARAVSVHFLVDHVNAAVQIVRLAKNISKDLFQGIPLPELTFEQEINLVRDFLNETFALRCLVFRNGSYYTWYKDESTWYHMPDESVLDNFGNHFIDGILSDMKQQWLERLTSGDSPLS